MTARIFSEEALLSPATRRSSPLVSPSTRRTVLLASLLTAWPIGLFAARAEAINPAETQVTLPDEIIWTGWTAGPPHSAEMAPLYGGLDNPWRYVVLMKWYPGYMNAPHPLCHQSTVFGAVGYMVGEQRYRFRPEGYRSGAGQGLRQAGRPHAASRRRQSRRERASGNRDFWARPSRSEIGRSGQAGVASGVAHLFEDRR